MGLMKLTGFVFSPVLLSNFQISGFEEEEKSFALCLTTGRQHFTRYAAVKKKTTFIMEQWIIFLYFQNSFIVTISIGLLPGKASLRFFLFFQSFFIFFFSFSFLCFQTLTSDSFYRASKAEQVWHSISSTIKMCINVVLNKM